MYLGSHYVEVISGFKGTCTAICTRICGAVDVELTPRAESPQDEPRWFSAERLAENEENAPAVGSSRRGGQDPVLNSLPALLNGKPVVDEKDHHDLLVALELADDRVGAMRLNSALLKLGYRRQRQPFNAGQSYVLASG
jgi:hypothetical protein